MASSESSGSGPSSPTSASDQRRQPTSKSKSKKAANGSKNRELLTQAQKSANHRRAEQSRRNECLVRLTMICDELIPGATGLAKSTESAYIKTFEHMLSLLREKKDLIEQVQALGGTVPQKELDAIAVLDEYEALAKEDEYDPRNSEERMEKEEEDEAGEGSDGSEDGADEEDEGSEGHEQEEDAVTAAESLSHMKNGK